MNEDDHRAALVQASRRLVDAGLNQGASGNISVRQGRHVLVTPSGLSPDAVSAGRIARMTIDDEDGRWAGPDAPSSEWRFHLAILRARPDVGAVVHTHAPHATALSMLRMPIPAVHYMIAAFNGPVVRCTAYAPFGSADLSGLAVEGLGARHGVLLGNHGMIVTGHDLATAMWRAQELETLARLYLLARSAGDPVVLSDAEIEDAIERFRHYGPASTLGGSP